MKEPLYCDTIINMNHRLPFFLAIALTVFLIFSCEIQPPAGSSGTPAGGQSEEQTPEPLPEDNTPEGDVSISYQNAPYGYFLVEIDYSNGASRRHVGQKLGQVINSQYPSYEGVYANYLEGKEDYALYIDRIKDIRPNIPTEFMDEVLGMADTFGGGETDAIDGKLSVNELLYFSIGTSVIRATQCNAFAVFGELSITGQTILSRTIDWSGYTDPAVYIYTYPSGKTIVNIGTLLSQSVATAFSSDGPFAAILDSKTGEAFPDLSGQNYRAYTFDIRHALENHATMQGVADYLSDSEKLYTFSHNIFLADSSQAKVLENNIYDDFRALRSSDSALNDGVTWGIDNAVGCVNSFMLDGNRDTHTENSLNTIRWAAMKTQLLAQGDTVDYEEMRTVSKYHNDPANDFLYWGLSQQLLVYDYSTSRLEVYFRNDREFTTDPDFVAVNLPF